MSSASDAPTTSSQKDFTVSIVGGGICGLALAGALVKAHVPVTVFEAASSFQEIGAGVGMGPNAIDALRQLGVLGDMIAKSDEVGLDRRGFEFYTGDSQHGHEFIYAYPTDEKTLGLGIHRASMLDVLVSILPPEIAHFNKRCVSVEPAEHRGGKAKLTFTDNSTYQADLVIGCDGVKSAIRNALSPIKPVFMNTIAYRSLIPFSHLKGFTPGELTCPRMYTGLDKHIICFPVRGGSLLNVVAFCCDRSVPYGEIDQPPGLSWVEPVQQEDLLDQFRGWCPHVQSILSEMTSPTKWTLYAVRPSLEVYATQNIALVGDSAHAMLPHLGAGASQGLEDAVLMTRLLGHPSTNKQNITDVLQAYSNVRVTRANRVQEMSTVAGEVWEGRGAHGPGIDGRRQDSEGIWDWVWFGYDADKEFESAVTWLKTHSMF